MTTLPENTSTRPSLRIAEMAISNFRTFRERTVIPFHGGALGADAIATFHGDNGSGKSNALAALDLFFNVAAACLKGEGSLQIPWDSSIAPLGREVRLLYRDRPTGTEEITSIEVRFEDEPLGTIFVQLQPMGNDVLLLVNESWSWGEARDIFSGLLQRMKTVREDAPNAPSASEQLGTLASRQERRALLPLWLTSPLGPGSQPLAIVNARRQTSWLNDTYQPSLLQPALAEALFAHRTSLRPDVRERWRAFTKTLDRFPTFRGKEVSIERLQPNASPELVVEERGKSVLRSVELSSGEQQIVVLCAAILTANAPIVAIEEPELSLDQKNQQLLKDILQEQINASIVDQIILESHVPSFDGPSVIRFHRGSDGSTSVTREPSVHEGSHALAKKAKEQGAEQRWVTADGYTQLPEAMRKELAVGTGKHIWFLRGPDYWEAWPEEELSRMLGGDEENPDD